jgi:hypothetical protein
VASKVSASVSLAGAKEVRLAGDSIVPTLDTGPLCKIDIENTAMNANIAEIRRVLRSLTWSVAIFGRLLKY